MADFTVSGIISVDVSRGIRDLKRFSNQLEKTWMDLEAIENKIHDLDGENIDLDIVTHGENLSDLRRQLKEIKDEEVKVDLDFDTTGDLADDMRRLNAEIDKLDDINVDVEIDAGDAIIDAMKLNEELDKLLRDQEVDVKVDHTGIDRFTNSVREARNSIGAPSLMPSLIGGITLLASSLIPLTAIAAGAGAGVAAGLGVMGMGAVSLAAIAMPVFQEFGASIKQIDEAVKGLEGPEKIKALNKAIKEVPADIRPAVEGFYKMKTAWEEAAESIKPEVVDAMGEAFKTAIPFIKGITPVASEAAIAIGNLFKTARKNLRGEEWQDFFGYLEENIGWFIETWGEAIGNFITGINNMIIALDPLSKFFSEGLLKMSEDFRNWSKNLESNESFQNFINFVKENGPLVKQFLGELITALMNLGRALAPLGVSVMEQVTAWLEMYNAWAKANPEANKMVGWVVGLAAGIATLAGPLTSVVGPIVTFLTSFIGVAGPIGAVVLAVAALETMLALTTDTGKQYNDMWAAIKDAWNAIKEAAQGAWEKLQQLWDVFRETGAIENFQAAIESLARVAETLAPALEPLAFVLGVTVMGAMLGTSWAIRGVAAALEFLVWAVEQNVKLIAAPFVWLYNFLVGNSVIPDLVRGIRDWFLRLPGMVLGALAGFPGRVAGVFGNMVGAVFRKLNELKNGAMNKFEEIKNGIGNKVGQAKDWAVNRFQEMKTGVTNKINEIKTNAQAGFQAAKSVVTTKMSEMKTSAVQKAAELISGMREKLNNAKTTVTNAFAGAGSWLVSAGSNLMSGLASGIESGARWAVGAAESVASRIAGLLPGSPVKWGPLRSFNNGGVGKKLMGMFADGIKRDSSVQNAMRQQVRGIDIPKLAMSETMGRSWDSLNRGISDANIGASMTSGGDRHYHIDVQVPVTASKADVGRAIVEAVDEYERAGGKKRNH